MGVKFYINQQVGGWGGGEEVIVNLGNRQRVWGLRETERTALSRLGASLGRGGEDINWLMA